MTLIDILMAVPLVLCAVIFLRTMILDFCEARPEMKRFIIGCLVVLWAIFSVLYFIAPAHSAEATLPMSATIINLTDVPLEEAIAFCDERNLVCPELRSQWDEITNVEFDAEGLNEISPSAGQEEVYE